LSQKVGRVGMQLKFYTNLDMLHMSAHSSLAQIWTCLTGGPTQVLHKFVHDCPIFRASRNNAAVKYIAKSYVEEIISIDGFQ
jgi:hypothetical protein